MTTDRPDHDDPLLHPDPEAEQQIEGGRRSMRDMLRRLAYPAAIAMLGLCIYFAVRGGGADDGPSGWQRLWHADPRHVAAMLLCVVGSVVLNGLVFWAIMKPFQTDRPVGLFDMTALIAATSLLNYLPMRAGMIGRAAYLKQRHGVGYRTSVVMLITVAGCTVITFALMTALTIWRGRIDAMWIAGMSIGLAVNALLGPIVLRYALRNVPMFRIEARWFDRIGLGVTALIWLWLWARAADVALNAARLWLAADVFGRPIDYPHAILLAAGGMFVTLLTPLPNGLGLRELLYGWFGSAGDMMRDMRSGLAVGLIDRAVEAVVFITLGLAAIGYLHRKQRSTDS